LKWKALLLLGAVGLLLYSVIRLQPENETADSASPHEVATPRATPDIYRSFPKATPPPVNPQAAGRPAFAAPDPASLQALPPHPESQILGSGELSAEQELELMQGIFQGYVEAMGSLPIGESNAQIMNALRGNNPKRWGWFPMQHPRLNEEGALTDEWGTPYFFHLLTQSRLEIRSAGPDRIWYSEDDLQRP